MQPVLPSCPCVTCQAQPVAQHTLAARLLAYAAPGDRPYVAAMLRQQHAWPDTALELLARLTGCRARDILDCARSLTMQQLDLARHRTQRVTALAADDVTRGLLLSAVHGRPLPGEGAPWTLTLAIQGKPVAMEVPPTRESLLVVLEIFVDETYGVPPAVETVVDVGANLGVATLWFHAHAVGRRFVCVEPVPSNVQLLRRNLERNGVEATVVEGAVGAASGTVTLHVPQGTHALASAFGQGAPLTVPVTPWERVVQPGVGLKVDAEGAEHSLPATGELLRGVRFLVGEVHDGPALVGPAESRQWWQHLERFMDVQEGRPEVFGETLTRTVVAVHRDGP